MPTNSPTLSLCMIVRNEAEILERCLESVRTLSDEIILVDTGSKDETMEIGRRFDATVLSFPWQNDFSRARNFSLEHATKDWILVLDADEVISQGDHSALQNLLLNDHLCGYTLEQRTYGYDPRFMDWVRTMGAYEEEQGFPGYVRSPLIRLFRRDPLIRFEGPVHELVEHSFSRHHLPYSGTSIPVHHYGKVREQQRIQQKARLYLEIGLEKADLDPHNAKVHCELGAQYVELKEYERAIEVFRKAIALRPEAQDTYVNMGVTYLRKGEYEEAERALRVALSLNPRNTDALLNLGATLLRLGRHEEAEKIIGDVMELRPDFGLAYATMGSLLLCQGRTEESVPFLLKAVAVNPGDADACSNLAWACHRLSWPTKALCWCRRALSLQPCHKSACRIERQLSEEPPCEADRTSAEALNREAEESAAQGNVHEAIALLQKASELDPAFAAAWNNLGVLLWGREDRHRAFTCFLRAFLSDHQDPDVHENLLWSCRELRRGRLWSVLEDLQAEDAIQGNSEERAA